MCTFFNRKSAFVALFGGLIFFILSNNVLADELSLPSLPSASSATKAPSTKAQRLATLAASIEQDHPAVRHISVAELKGEFEDALLIDVRERDEYEMSHLPGALHANIAADIDALRLKHPDRAMVFYCTVGRRSAVAAEAFVARNPAADEPPVVNLAGSIFAWANSGEPLVDAQGPTTEVHPYSFWWGWRYLDADRGKRPKPP